MADITPGYTYSSGSPTNQVTASNLNALVGSATVNTALVTAKSLKSTPVSADTVLLVDSADGTFKRATLGTLPTQPATSRRSFTTLTAYCTDQVTIVAAFNEITLRSNGGLVKYFGSTSVSAQINRVGTFPVLGGLDYASGSPTTSTWHYMYVISDGSVTDAIISKSPTLPTLPAGYLYFTLVCAFYIDGSSHATKFRQNGQDVYVFPSAAADTTNALNPTISATDFTNQKAGTAFTFQTVSFATSLPPNITSRVRCTFGSTAIVNHLEFAVAAEASGSIASAGTLTSAYGLQIYASEVAAGAASAYKFFNPIQFECPVTTSQTIAVAWSDATNSQYSLRVNGYTLNL